MKKTFLIVCMLAMMVLLVSFGSVCADIVGDSISSSDEYFVGAMNAVSDGDYDDFNYGSELAGSAEEDYESGLEDEEWDIEGVDDSKDFESDGNLDEDDGEVEEDDDSDLDEDDGEVEEDDDSDLDEDDGEVEEDDDDSDLDDDEDYDDEEDEDGFDDWDEYGDAYDLGGEGPGFYATSASSFYMAKGMNGNVNVNSSDFTAGSDFNDRQNVDLSIKTGNPLVPLLISLFSLILIPFKFYSV